MKPALAIGLMVHTAYQCLQARFAHQVGAKATGHTTMKMTTTHLTAMLRGTAGFRTPKNFAKILVGDFAAKHTIIIPARERLGPKDRIVFLDMVVHVLQASIKVRK